MADLNGAGFFALGVAGLTLIVLLRRRGQSDCPT